MKYLNNIWEVAKRCKILYVNRIYGYCMVVFPLLAMLFFTSLLNDGVPQEMPVGIVDLDNTSMTRALGRKLDGFQNSKVVANYTSVTEARKAMQENEIYGLRSTASSICRKVRRRNCSQAAALLSRSTTARPRCRLVRW